MEEFIFSKQDWEQKYSFNESVRLSRRFEAKRLNAGSRGIEFSLNKDDLFMLGSGLLGYGKCDYTGMDFSTVLEDGPKYPTFERIDNEKGYIRGNVCIVLQRANKIKDCVMDRADAILVKDPTDREILQAMMKYLSKQHMEELKTKYVPCTMNEVIQTEKEEEDMQEETKITLPPEEDAIIEVPQDVAIAGAYAKYCTDFAKAGMKVSVTYTQFKARYVRKTCTLSGEVLETEPKFILILDLQKGFSKGNFIIVSEKMGKAITTMMITTGYSVPRLVEMFNKAV